MEGDEMFFQTGRPGFTGRNVTMRIGLILMVVLCFGSGRAGAKDKNPPSNPPNPFPGVSFKVADATVPPGGVLQLQLFLTEPKPIGHGGSRLLVPGSLVGSGVGVSLNDPSGQASGVAVSTADGVQV